MTHASITASPGAPVAVPIPHDLPIAQESIPPGEAGAIAALEARLKEKLAGDHPPGKMRRDVHVKMHGIVKAEFSVHADLPAELRIGIFREPRTYPAWIRFSNADGSAKPDNARDVRGMAIKLMGVPGEKLLEREKDEQTQDFILISTRVFPTRDVEEFDALAKAMFGSVFAKIRFFLTHWRTTWILYQAMARFASLLQIRYFSTTPYLLGTHAVKYCATPRTRAPDGCADSSHNDFLRLDLAEQLRAGEARFDFSVQLQVDAEAMPIEDPRREWAESMSPFRQVATLRILQQDIDHGALNAFGENLSFTPWHSLPEHRPLGGVNRARMVIYDAISTFRHASNQVPRKEPGGW